MFSSSPSLPLPVLYPEAQKAKMIHKYKWVKLTSSHSTGKNRWILPYIQSDNLQQLYVQKRTRLDVFLKTMKKYYALTRVFFYTSTEVDTFFVMHMNKY